VSESVRLIEHAGIRKSVPGLSWCIRTRFTYCPKGGAPKSIWYGVYKKPRGKFKHVVFAVNFIAGGSEYNIASKLGSDLL
jgi:hypothetical protein